MRKLFLAGLVCACAGLSACGETPKSPAADKPQAAPAIPEDIAAVARGALGSEAEVLAWGDLALTGQQQVLAINRLIKPPSEQVPGILLTRLAVLGNDGGKWNEVMLCDEHLKNTNGYLGGTPTASVSAWRLQYEKNPKLGLLLFFIPFKQGPEVRDQTIEVRWNPEAKRYQAMDATYTIFIGETPQLEEVHRPLGH